MMRNKCIARRGGRIGRWKAGMREVTIILSHALETWDLVLSWVYHFCYFFHCFVLLLQVWSLVRAQTVSIILLVFCWALGYLVVICLVQCWNTRHYKPCRTERMIICSTTVLSTWYLIICKITGTPTKYTSVKTKLKNPQLKALNTEKLFLWRNRVFCFITNFRQVLDRQVLDRKGLNVAWKCARTAVEKESQV